MTYSRCDPGDHDDTGARTDQHAMDLVSAEWILRKARDNGWPGSPFPNKARHHQCGNLLARDYVNQFFSEPGAADSETGRQSPEGGYGSPPRQEPHLPDHQSKGVGLPTEKELAQMRAAMVESAKSGDADTTAKLQAVYDLATGQDLGPGDDD